MDVATSRTLNAVAVRLPLVLTFVADALLTLAPAVILVLFRDISVLSTLFPFLVIGDAVGGSYLAGLTLYALK